MQSQSNILLAEIRNNEFQAEAARLRIVNQACAHRPMASGVVAGARQRFRIELANAAARLHVFVQGQKALATSHGRGSPAVSGLSADTL